MTIFVFAAIPSPLFDVVGFAAGSMGIPLRHFIIACLLGKLAEFSIVVASGFWGATFVLGLFS